MYIRSTRKICSNIFKSKIANNENTEYQIIEEFKALFEEFTDVECLDNVLKTVITLPGYFLVSNN